MEQSKLSYTVEEGRKYDVKFDVGSEVSLATPPLLVARKQSQLIIGTKMCLISETITTCVSLVSNNWLITLSWVELTFDVSCSVCNDL